MKSKKNLGTIPSADRGAVTTGDQRAESAVDPLKFYSENDPWTVTACDDGGLMVHTKGDVICHSDRNHAADDPADMALFPVISAALEMFSALLAVRKIIIDGAMTGFNCHDGDWAERLFASQQVTHAAITKAKAPIPRPDKPRDDGTWIEPGHEPGGRGDAEP